MPDNIRWRAGCLELDVASVGPETVIEVGDLLWGDDESARPASDLALAERRLGCKRCGSVVVIPTGNRAFHLRSGRICPTCRIPGAWLEARESEVLQRLFSDHFLGVAMQRSDFGAAEVVLIAISGLFEFDCPLARFKRGDLLGVDWEGIEGQAVRPLNQSVNRVTAAAAAIGRAADSLRHPVTSILVEIQSTLTAAH